MIVQNVHNILTGLTRKLSRLPLAVATTMLLVGLSACDDKNEPIPSKPKLPEGKTFLSVVVTSDSPSARGGEWGGPTWGDEYNSEAGNDFEKKIRQDRVHVALLKADGTPIGYNENGVPLGNYYTGDIGDDIMILPMPGHENTFYVYFDVSNLNLIKGNEYVLAVTANYTNNSQPAISRISDTTFRMDSLINHKAGEIVDPTEYYKGSLPMFGVMRWNYGTLEAKDGYFDTSTIGTVQMLRSVCKIEVLLPTEEQSAIAPFLEFNDENKPHLAFVSGKHLNKTGYITPKKEKWLNTAIKQTTNIKFTDSYNARVDRWTSADANVPHLYLPATIKNEEGKTMGYYIYLPEASGHSMEPYEDALRLNVSVKYTPEGDTDRTRIVTGTLFPSIPYDEENQRYPDDTNYNDWRLYRNHIYRFTIKAVANETSLDYNVSVTGDKTINVPDFE
ncbi:MAG: hypothetical protein K2K82_05215 [Muribaculaceae bacterium]|nr:hypothetical protein [Muribaculaceae bacterium]